MSRLKRLLLLLPILGISLPAITCQAKYEQTTEIELIDMGHGIYIPSSFDVINEDGLFATLSYLDLTPWLEAEIDEWSYSITLDNGYRAEKSWIPIEGERTGYMCTTVYNENGEMVFFVGNDWGQIKLVMIDDAGNHLTNVYSRQVITENNGREDSYSGEIGAPLTRSTYSASENIRKVYGQWKEDMRLFQKYEYDTADGDICRFYNVTSDTYDLDDEYYEESSYRKEDLQEYWLRGTVYNLLTGKAVYLEYPYQLPSVQTINGVKFYLYVLEQWEFDWSLEEEREVMDGKPEDITHYFTKEQIEILEAEHITTYEELMERYPEFWDASFYIPPGVEYITGTPSDGVSESERTAQNAIISPNIENAPENAEGSEDSGRTGSASDWHTSEYGRSLTQPLTGDVLAINGSVPTMLITNVLNTPSGEQFTMTLIDDNYNNLATMTAFDIEHTNYKYAYLTEINADASFTYFAVAGSDTPISGNLQYVGQSDVDTENGTEQESLYTDPTWN